MPNYRAYVTLSQYRVFDFEAEDEELAWDHADTLINNLGYDRIFAEWEESGPEFVELEDVGEI